MKKFFFQKTGLTIEIVLTLIMSFALDLAVVFNVTKNVDVITAEAFAKYSNLVRNYTSCFMAIVNQTEDKIVENVSFDDMQNWLYAKDGAFGDILGKEIFDGFALTYKGGYAHSWNYGNYENYDPNTRPWYIQAAIADGQIVIVPPYITFLDASVINNDQIVIMSLAQRYNDEISFDLDIKISEISSLLSVCETETDGTIALFLNKDGNILSTNKKELYCHNIRVSDSVMTASLSETLISLENTSKRSAIVNTNGIVYFAFSLPDTNGNTMCILVPALEIFFERILPILCVSLLLIALEVAVFAQNRRRLTELSNKENDMAKALESSHVKRYVVDLPSMICIGNEATGETYRSVYERMLANVRGADGRTEFEHMLSPKSLSAALPSDMHKQIFTVTLPLGNSELLLKHSYSVIIPDDPKDKRAVILIVDLTNKANVRKKAMDCLVSVYSTVLLANTKKKYYILVKNEPGFEDEMPDDGITVEARVMGFSRLLTEDSRDKFNTMFSFDAIENGFKDKEKLKLTVETVSAQKYHIIAAKCENYADSGEFILCFEKV